MEKNKKQICDIVTSNRICSHAWAWPYKSPRFFSI